MIHCPRLSHTDTISKLLFFFDLGTLTLISKIRSKALRIRLFTERVEATLFEFREMTYFKTFKSQIHLSIFF